MELALCQRFLALFLVLLLWAPQVLSSPLKAAQFLPRQEEERPSAFDNQCGTTHFCQNDRERRPDCVDAVHGYTLCQFYFSKTSRMYQVCKDCVDTNCDASGCEWFG
ncbi:hypothetical protein I7I48_00791 [Histoplasma ohiense]|nr:hypothetical protein I7I48_00791 [Histoplasma ohiense (nom. inval.)]